MSNLPPRRPALMSIEQSPLHRAFDNYNEMERQWQVESEKNRELSITNASLLAEVGMLREALRDADADRIRLQAIASTFTGQAMALNSVIADMMRMAVKNGIDAAQRHEEQGELEHQGAEVREILHRIKPEPVEEPPQPEPEQTPHHGGTILPVIDFGRR